VNDQYNGNGNWNGNGNNSGNGNWNGNNGGNQYNQYNNDGYGGGQFNGNGQYNGGLSGGPGQYNGSGFDPYVDASANLAAKNMQRVYFWMFIGLMVTAVVSVWSVDLMMNMVISMQSTAPLWIVMIAELVIVWVLSARVMKMQLATARTMFIAYAVLNGLSLAPIFAVYNLGDISVAFFSAAGAFGGMSLLGFVTKKDLSGMGRFLTMCLFGLIIAMVINLFVGSGTFTVVISLIGVVLFAGLTAYDTQKIKRMSSELVHSGQSASDIGAKFSIMAALTLYLDFINMFLFILRLIGNNRN
jgi:FtsH-binding integral membrane protein